MKSRQASRMAEQSRFMPESACSAVAVESRSGMGASGVAKKPPIGKCRSKSQSPTSASIGSSKWRSSVTAAAGGGRQADGQIGLVREAAIGHPQGAHAVDDPPSDGRGAIQILIRPQCQKAVINRAGVARLGAVAAIGRSAGFDAAQQIRREVGRRRGVFEHRPAPRQATAMNEIQLGPVAKRFEIAAKRRQRQIGPQREQPFDGEYPSSTNQTARPDRRTRRRAFASSGGTRRSGPADSPSSFGARRATWSISRRKDKVSPMRRASRHHSTPDDGGTAFRRRSPRTVASGRYIAMSLPQPFQRLFGIGCRLRA